MNKVDKLNLLIMDTENKCPFKYETAITESGEPINPAEFWDDETEEVDWERFYEECEY